MSAPSWIVREAGEGDFERVRELYRTVWGFNRPMSYDRWRYFDMPDGPAPLTVAFDGEKIIGSHALFPVRMRLGSEVALASQLMDTQTHPDYRGQGVFVATALACYEIAARRGYEFIYALPNPLSYPGFVKHMNWNCPGGIGHWVRPVRPSRHPRMPGALGPIADAVAGLWPKGGGRGLDVAVAPPTEEERAGLLADWCPGIRLCRVERTPQWYAWRYAESAAMGYEWIVARRAGKIAAAGVLGMKDATWEGGADGRAHVVELLGSDRDGLSAVLAAMIGRADARGAWLIETLTDIDPIVAVLRRAGFVRKGAPPLIVRRLNARNLDANVHLIDSWRFMGGDVDTF